MSWKDFRNDNNIVIIVTKPFHSLLLISFSSNFVEYLSVNKRYSEVMSDFLCDNYIICLRCKSFRRLMIALPQNYVKRIKHKLGCWSYQIWSKAFFQWRLHLQILLAPSKAQTNVWKTKETCRYRGRYVWLYDCFWHHLLVNDNSFMHSLPLGISFQNSCVHKTYHHPFYLHLSHCG